MKSLAKSNCGFELYVQVLKTFLLVHNAFKVHKVMLLCTMADVQAERCLLVLC